MSSFLGTSGLTYLWGKIKILVGQKQDSLVSGTNIKTVNNQSLLGSGNIDISAGGSYIAYPSFNIDNNGHLIMTDGAEGLFTIENGHLKYNF